MGNQVLGMRVLAHPVAEPSFEGDQSNKSGEKPCRACTDFKSWAKFQTQRRREASTSESAGAEGNQVEEHESVLAEDRAHLQCPLDKDELGRATWSFLHSMAAYFPDSPTKHQQKEMSAFVKIFAKYYPCEHCARDFQQSIRESPPATCNRVDFSQWLCKMHNEVNRKLGKPEFDCGLVDERWRDGWNDGSCDS